MKCVLREPGSSFVQESQLVRQKNIKQIVYLLFYISVESDCAAQLHFFIKNLPHLEPNLKHL